MNANEKLSPEKKWIISFIAALAVLLVIFVIMSEWMLHRINEDTTGKAVVDAILEEDALLGSAISEDIYYYKIHAAKRIQPEILFLGSSRVTQFRSAFFRDKSSYTMGGTGPCVDDVSFTYNELKDSIDPEIIILGLDIWWFNPEVDHSPRPKYMWNKNVLQQRSHLYFSLWNSIGSNAHVREELIAPTWKSCDPYWNLRTFGLNAGAAYTGYRPDGSMQHGNLYDEKPEENDMQERFADAFHRMETGTNRFEWTTEVEEEEVRKLKTLIETIKESGAELIVFMPPFPHIIWQTMLGTDHYSIFLKKLISELSALCEQEQVAFYDFSDMSWFGSDDSEAIDGFHGSEKTYARLCLKLAEDPQAEKYIDRQAIEKMIQDSDSSYFVLLPD